jgi:hypothetical protein
MAFFAGRKLEYVEEILALPPRKREQQLQQIKFLEDWAKERGFITGEAITSREAL